MFSGKELCSYFNRRCVTFFDSFFGLGELRDLFKSRKTDNSKHSFSNQRQRLLGRKRHVWLGGRSELEQSTEWGENKNSEDKQVARLERLVQCGKVNLGHKEKGKLCWGGEHDAHRIRFRGCKLYRNLWLRNMGELFEGKAQCGIPRSPDHSHTVRTPSSLKLHPLILHYTNFGP